MKLQTIEDLRFHPLQDGLSSEHQGKNALAFSAEAAGSNRLT